MDDTDAIGGAPKMELEDALMSASRWAYKYTLLAMWVRSNCTPEQVAEAREFVAEGVATSPLAPEPPTDKPRYTTPGVHPQYDMLPAADDDAIMATLARFGWEATPMFRDKYANDAWFHNVVNALVALSTAPETDR